MSPAEPVTFADVSVGDRIRSPSWPYEVVEIAFKDKARVVTTRKCKNGMVIREALPPELFDAARFERVVLG